MKSYPLKLRQLLGCSLFPGLFLYQRVQDRGGGPLRPSVTRRRRRRIMFSNHTLLKAAWASIRQYIQYARAPRGERAEVEERFETGSNISGACAGVLRGAHAPMMIEGAIEGEA